MPTGDTLLDIPMEDLVLTTIDNPYSPKTEYDKWKQFDVDNHYNTEEYLARVTNLPGDMELDNDPKIEELTTQAIHSILEHDVLGIYRLI